MFKECKKMTQDLTKIPDFTAQLDGNHISQEIFRKGKFILYFYPKDDTPGCTKEACDFRDSFEDLQKLGYKIFGASKDNLNKHYKFKEKYGLPFDLITDEDGSLCSAFDVFVQKSFMGKKYMGIERSTFLIEDGFIIKSWRNVSATSHVKNVLDFIDAAKEK